MAGQAGSAGTILVAIDGSPASQASAETAIEIANKENLIIWGIYIVDEALVYDRYVDYKAELDQNLREIRDGEPLELFEMQGAQATRWLEKRCLAAGVPVIPELLFGGVPELITQRTQESELLALGRNGNRHALDNGHLGHNFRSIAHRSRAPLLIGGGNASPIHRVLLAYDGSEKAQRALYWARRLQSEFESRVWVVSAATDPADSQAWFSKMRADIEQRGLMDFDFLSREGDPSQEILAAAEENRIDLILMGRYGHSAWVDRITGSTLDRVLRNTSLAVLAA